MKPFHSMLRIQPCVLISAAVTALAVFGTVGCTGTQRAGADRSAEQITLTNATVMVNGENFGDEATLTADGPARGIFALTLGDNGTFLISERIFEGSLPTAHVSGNRLEATYYDHTIVIQSEGTIHPAGEADLWVRHDPKFHVHADSVDPAEARSYWTESYEQYLKQIAGNRPGNAFRSPTEKGYDFFVVIEQEPKLIGGMLKLLERVEYPEEARRNGIEGTVTVRFIIEPDGTPSNLEVIEGIGGGCDEAAMAAVREARFEPGRVDGQPIRVQYSLPILFRL